MSTTLTGVIDRVTFHNPENGFVVLRVLAVGERYPVYVVGLAPRAVAGETIEATGEWKDDPEHGRQFAAGTLHTKPPSDKEGIEKFLGSGLIKGIGPVYAKKIVAVFGERTLQVIDDSPAFLAEIKGLGPRRIQQIRESWRQQKGVRDLLIFLQTHGLGQGRAVRIYKTYGDKAVDRVKENPYRLAVDIWGIGFATADDLAGKLGIDRHSPLRVQAGLRHVLAELAKEGHCGFSETEVQERVRQLIGVDQAVVQEAVQALIGADEVARETEVTPEPWLYRKALFTAETGVAENIRRLADGQHPLPGLNADAALAWVEKKMGLELAPGQRAALRQAATQKMLIVTGGPGVGKTTIVRGILEIFQAKGKKCRLAAPTGRAAKRLRETTGGEASTLHRLLEFQAQGPHYHPGKPLDLDLLVVDEASMIDVTLMHQVLRALPDQACLVLVGDVDQLPSVGPGRVLADVIASRAVPVARLTEIFRQAQESGIVRAAHAILQGQPPESAPQDRLGDFYFIEVDQPAVIAERIIALVRVRIPTRFKLDPLQDVQVLSPMHRGELGVASLNQKLQAVLNPPDEETPEVQRGPVTFRLGDKVLQTVNNYDKGVFNGDVGRIRALNLEDQEAKVLFDTGPVVYDFDELDELTLAYAMTIHKAQGSEYPAVVMPVHTQHFLLLQRNLLYTGLTRGKKLVVLVGSRQALNLAVGKQDARRRCSALTERLGISR